MGRRVRRGARHVGELGMDFEPGPLRLVPVVLICFLCVRVCVETFLLGLMWFLCEYMKITLLLIAAGVPFITRIDMVFVRAYEDHFAAHCCRRTIYHLHAYNFHSSLIIYHVLLATHHFLLIT